MADRPINSVLRPSQILLLFEKIRSTRALRAKEHSPNQTNAVRVFAFEHLERSQIVGLRIGFQILYVIAKASQVHSAPRIIEFQRWTKLRNGCGLSIFSRDNFLLAFCGRPTDQKAQCNTNEYFFQSNHHFPNSKRARAA